MILRSIVFAVLSLTTASTSLAQQKDPISPFVVDLRVASSGLPADQGWTPLVPAGTVVPSRGLGFDVGGHVNVWRRRSFALGVGASWLVARGSTSPPEAGEGATPGAPTIPSVNTSVKSFAPQVSFNFGHSLGWSYLSAGLGRTRVESEAALAGGSTTYTPLDSGWVKTLNYGGGARWFLNDRVGVGFDLRWHKVGLVPSSAIHAGAPRASLVVAGVGMVIK